MDGVEILPIALTHGVSEGDIRHALRNAFDVFPDQGKWNLTMAIGPATNGVTILEVGYDRAENGRYVVIHAMSCRPKYNRENLRKR